MTKRLSIPAIKARKGSDTPLVVLTCYTAPMARLLDTHCDILLVGDSIGMVVYGMESTLPVTLEIMSAHGKAVVAHSSKPAVVVDLPFGTYQASPARAFTSAAKLMKETGADAVKLEGGAEMARTIKHLVERGIPVMAHIGLLPQHVNAMGGYKVQGKTKSAHDKLVHDAKAVTKAGAFAIVIEGVQEDAAKAITTAVDIPTIGIGAAPECDGQVLVLDDMLGITEHAPKFAKRYADLSATITKAVSAYATEVRARKFPGKENLFQKKG